MIGFGSHIAAQDIPTILPDPDGKPGDADKPLKVYILAGQSNMQGCADVRTFDYIGDDPATANLLKEMRGPDGKPHVCERVWISYFTGSRDTNGEGFGKLTAGYGARSNPAEDGGKIGPEFTFGITMEKAHDGPILIIKTAWGGKSLNTDFRPPSAGPYVLPKKTKELWAEHPQGAHGIPKAEDRPKWHAEKAAKTGVYYRLMMDHIKKVLADPKRVCPVYDDKAGYEIAGFVWFQGWNDMCDGHTYPERHKPGGYAEYSRLMAHFIRDVRKELAAPTMHFLIGVIGVHGDSATGGIANLRPAMAAAATMPEFQGNVVAVETAPYWDEALASIEDKHSKVNGMAYFLRTEHKDHANKDGKMTPEQQRAYVKEYRAKLITAEEDAFWQYAASHQGYHYFGSAKTFAQIGQAFAEALLEM
jgi:alpha-galactosidase